MDLGSPPLCSFLRAPPCLSAGGVCGGEWGARGRSSKAEKRKAFGPNSEGFCPSPPDGKPCGGGRAWGSWVE